MLFRFLILLPVLGLITSGKLQGHHSLGEFERDVTNLRDLVTEVSKPLGWIHVFGEEFAVERHLDLVGMWMRIRTRCEGSESCPAGLRELLVVEIGFLEAHCADC
ncbi:hypothetical protein B0H12DRAFT_90760 [Mycena haematopus]|nr:hypothetical protein B0H12DRAFT_90760 [Mycena haematopus]